MRLYEVRPLSELATSPARHAMTHHGHARVVARDARAARLAIRGALGTAVGRDVINAFGRIPTPWQDADVTEAEDLGEALADWPAGEVRTV